jgi:ankyrin repeat protein
MKLHDQHEKQNWLTSIRSCAMGHNKQVTAGNDTMDVEESARRMHRVMKTTLCSAAMHGKPDVVEKYLMTSKDTVRETDGLGNTAAYYAVQQGHNVCLAMLLDAGADPNALDHEERTLATLALGNKNLRAVEMLEASGAKLSTEERDAMQQMMDDALSAEKGKRGDQGGGDSAAGGESDAKGAMADAMNQLNERGEKLQELDQKTANLANEAASFHDMAKQLKQKAKRDQERRIFGIF